MTPRRARRQRGFTLLEAIVAVAILGMALMPLLAFISQSALDLRLAGDANARSLAQQNVLAFLETLNPMERPAGEADLGDLHVTWVSRQAVPEIPDSTLGNGMPGFRLGFFDVNVQVHRNRALWFGFDARKFGFHSNRLSMEP